MTPASDGDMEKPNSKYFGPNALKPVISKLREAENSVSIKNVGFVNTPLVSALYSAAFLAYVNRDRDASAPSSTNWSLCASVTFFARISAAPARIPDPIIHHGTVGPSRLINAGDSK